MVKTKNTLGCVVCLLLLYQSYNKSVFLSREHLLIMRVCCVEDNFLRVIGFLFSVYMSVFQQMILLFF